MAWDIDQKFTNMDQRDAIDESDFLQFSVGIDRVTFIPFLNRTRTAFLSFQTFVNHMFDYPDAKKGQGTPLVENYVISTFFMENYWRSDTIVLTTFVAVDWSLGQWPRARRSVMCSTTPCSSKAA